MQLYPGLIHHAVLLRAVQVLEEAPAGDLKDVSVLLLDGTRDPWVAGAPTLREALATRGAHIDHQELPVGHELGPLDVPVVAEWLTKRFVEAPQ